MAVRSRSEVKEQFCAIVSRWVRVALLIDRSDTAAGKECSIHLHEHATVHPLSKTCASDKRK